MRKRNSTVYTILRTIRQPTKLDEVISSVPKPKGAIPNFGLPKWKCTPLECKIPLVPGPEGAYYFSRNKIGKQLYKKSSRNAEFDLTDPNQYDIAFEYDSLHDRHLARYFSDEKTLLRMKKLGFITEDLDAICSVKEYNMYRKYMQKLHGENVKRELRRRGELEAEKRDLRAANREAHKEAAKLKKNDKKNEARIKMDSPQLQAEEKRRRLLIKQQQTEERLKMLESKKKDQKERVILRAKVRAEHLKQRRRCVWERDRQKIVKVLLKWRQKDRDRNKRQRKSLREADEARREATEKKWMERERYQEWLLTIEKFLLEYAQGEAKRNIEKYMKKVERECDRIRIHLLSVIME
ncbi:fibrous sheath-interacting protein 2 isoform X2 [Diachasmimorpha longicaudata]|uniref:fibrous sheath-interacting protein 2 isoform X2 n=1 Tax=Diachasmimorpha longicaudata TaxID=58733 RepID=UPI0030B8D072